MIHENTDIVSTVNTTSPELSYAYPETYLSWIVKKEGKNKRLNSYSLLRKWSAVWISKSLCLWVQTGSKKLYLWIPESLPHESEYS